MHSVLEVGTGCGYQTTVLAPCYRLYTIEAHPASDGPREKERIKELGIRNGPVPLWRRHRSWKAHAPFDGILRGGRLPDSSRKR